MNSEPSGSDVDITRREAISAIGLATSGLVLSGGANAATIADGASTNPIAVQFRINGQPFHQTIDPRVTLLDLLRDHAGLTGTKKGCDHGQCGACTVLANDRRINSCLSLAATHDGDEITTVEGLAHNGELHPVQAAFIDHDGFQCGYCTPGQICSAVALLAELKRGDASVVTANLRSGAPDITDDEIRERMSGNICRCGAYQGIVAAVKKVASGDLEQARVQDGIRP